MGNSDKVKWIHRTWISGTGSIDISAYSDNYTIAKIVLTPIYGTSWHFYLGWSPGSNEVLKLEEIYGLPDGVPFICRVDYPPAPGQDTLYYTIPIGNFTIDIMFLQYIGA